MKDYENEIVICEEGMERLHATKAGILEARRDKAISLLFALQEREKMQQEKKKIAAQQKEKMPSGTNNAEVTSTTRGRGIMQLGDDGSVICEYETIAAAVRATGINSKSMQERRKPKQDAAPFLCRRRCRKFSRFSAGGSGRTRLPQGRTGFPATRFSARRLEHPTKDAIWRGFYTEP